MNTKKVLIFIAMVAMFLPGCTPPIVTDNPASQGNTVSIQILNPAIATTIKVQATATTGTVKLAKATGDASFSLENLPDGQYTIEAFGSLSDNQIYFSAKSSIEAAKTKQVLLTMEEIRVQAPIFDTPSQSNLATGDVVKVHCNTIGAKITYTLDGSLPTSSSPEYKAPGIVLTSTAVITVQAFLTGLLESPSYSQKYTVSSNTTLVPTFDPLPGTYQSVSLKITGEGEIRYTLDGTDPTSTSPIYGSAISLNEIKEYTVKAFAKASGKLPSGILEGKFVSTGAPVQTQKPVLIPGEGTFQGSVKVKVTGEPNSSFFYTLDGTEPTATSTAFPVVGLTFTKNELLKVCAIATGKTLSQTTSGSYTITPLPITASPSFSLATGTFQGPQTLKITSEIGASTYVTIDGTLPTADPAKLYTSEILLNLEKTYTVRAFSTKAGQVDSPEASVLITIKLIPTDEYKIYFYHPVAGEIPEAYVWYTPTGGSLTTPLGAWATTKKMTPWTHAGWYVADLLGAGVPLNQQVGIIIKINSTKLSSNTDQSRTKTGWLSMDNGTAVWSDDDPFKAKAPTIGVLPAPGLYSTDVVVTVTITENNSPIVEKSYTINNGLPKTLPADGKITLPVAALVENAYIELAVTAKNSIGTTQWGPYQYTKKTQVIETDHRGLRLYQVMVEAYQDGSAAGFGSAYGPSSHNGDIRGIINALDYIKGTGANALWLTPIFDSWTGEYKGQASGYYADDYFKVEPTFGGEADFIELVQKAHAKGLFVILDGVFGHHGAADMAASPKGGFKVTNLASQWYGYTVDYNQPGTLGYFKEVATYWIEKYGIDGWRLDQAYQVPTWAWKQIREAVEQAAQRRANAGEEWGTLGYMVGEILSGDPVVVKNQAYGTDAAPGLNSAFDFPIRYKIIQVLATQEDNNEAGAQNQPATHLKAGLDDRTRINPSHALPNLFLSNHDMIRFGDLLQRSNLKLDTSMPDYWKRHKAAWAFIASVSGPLTLFYGDEYGDEVPNFINKGDSGLYEDHASRSDGKISGFSTAQNDLRAYVKSLLDQRTTHSALWKGTRTNLTADTTRLAELKVDGTNRVLFVLNVGTSATTMTYTSTQLGGSQLKDILTGETLSASAAIPVPGLSGRFLQVLP